MRKFQYLNFLVSIFLLTGCLSYNRSNDPQSMSGKTAMEYFADEGIKVGWNLGNTLDAYNSWSYAKPVAEEGCWYNIPLANQKLFYGVKEQGFDIVRIPVTWMGHIGPAPDYKVSQARLKRVARVAGYAHNAGLKAIINIMHDDNSESGWLLLGNAFKSQDENNQITEKYIKVWKQIAEHFKDYGDWLIFESMNEAHDEDWGWSEGFRSNPKAYIDIINNWNQCFTDAVRATGSNNSYRFLMYPSFISSPEGILPDGKYALRSSTGVVRSNVEIGKYFILPTDSAGTGRQIVTCHYYDFFEFVVPFQGTPLDWGTQNEKNAIDSMFARLKEHYIDKKIPVILGETGRSRPSGKNLSGSEMRAQQIEAANAARLRWVEYIFSKARENGIVPVWWDNGNYKTAHEKDQFGLINRKTGGPNSDESAGVLSAIMNAVR